MLVVKVNIFKEDGVWIAEVLVCDAETFGKSLDDALDMISITFN